MSKQEQIEWRQGHIKEHQKEIRKRQERIKRLQISIIELSKMLSRLSKENEMPITKESLQEHVDKLLPDGYARVFDSSYPDCLVTHIEVGASAYIDVNRELLSHMPDRMIAALEQIKALVDHSIAMIQENS